MLVFPAHLKKAEPEGYEASEKTADRLERGFFLLLQGLVELF